MKAKVVFTVLAVLAGLAMIVAGPIMVYKGIDGQSQITTQLSAQHIQFPPAGSKGLPADLSAFGGVKVSDGDTAKAYADMVEEHVLGATGGKTYSEVSGEFMALSDEQKATPDGQKVAGLRQTAFMGEALRGTLMSAYQAWQVTWLVIGLGALITALAVVLFAAAAVTWPRKRTVAEADAA